MPRWYKIFSVAIPWIGRFYGLCLLAIGAVFLYLGGRGLIGFANGTRAAWSDPVAWALGLIIAGLSFWAGSNVVRNRQLAEEFVVGGKVDHELDGVLDQVDRLKDSDPVRAQRILEEYAARENARFERRVPKAGG